MGQALYRTYRSKGFDEVVGQDHITKTLREAIKSGRISHAYLFTGPRGVGKTSVARILAREINSLDYTNEDLHLDIIEIDAASNRRIDEIRDLRDKVHISPTSSKYKVYIIDEVHMLTKEAFNALLKTLEEPPAHCIFILATTEAHKLPETIISRTQRFNFKPIATKDAVSHLKQIASKEKISIDDDALELIARYGEGSFRDSIGLLDQLSSSGKSISAEIVRQHLGLPEEETVARLIQFLEQADAKSTIALIDDLRYQAIEPAAITESLSDTIRKDIASGSLSIERVDLLRDLSGVAASPKPFEALELALLSYISKQAKAEAPERKQSLPKIQQEEQKTAPKAEAKEEPEPAETEVAEVELEPAKPDRGEHSGSFDLKMWDELLNTVKSETPSLFTALRLAVPKIENEKLFLYFEFLLHQKKVNSEAHKRVVADAVNKVSGASLEIVCEVNKDLVRSANDQPAEDFYNSAPAPDESVNNISNIFGNAEVLES